MNDQTLMDILERIQNRFYGKYRGTVSQIEKQGSTGRIKARVPAVLGDQETGWCMPCLPYAGDQVGIAFLPEEGAGVWIEFEGGDVSYPIWVGCYWHDNEKPDRVTDEVKVVKTKNLQIVLDEHVDSITISDAHKNSVTLESGGITLVRGRGKVEISDGQVKVNDPAMVVT